MKKCKLCNAVLNTEDLIADDEFCLECIDDLYPTWETDMSRTLHQIRTPQGEISLTTTPSSFNGRFLTTELLWDWEVSTPSHRKEENFNTAREAAEHYLTLIRKLL